jgi:polyhydroxybutyrate depolymerase
MKVGLGIVAVAAGLAIPWTTGAGLQSGIPMHWTVDGVQRDAIVFPPAPTTAAARHALVFAFHGHGGSAQGAVVQMHLQTLWRQAVVVYPQGLDSPSPLDPSGTQPGWQFKTGDSDDRDLKLFDAMVATLKQRYRVDQRRIYTTGFSNGAIFSYLLWADRAKTIAAVGEAAGSLDPTETLTTPRALLAIAGRQDPIEPLGKQLASINRARQADHATGSGVPCGPTCTFYPSAGGNKTPVKTLVHAGGHVYPPWAPLSIVRFFKAHPQP